MKLAMWPKRTSTRATSKSCSARFAVITITACGGCATATLLKWLRSRTLYSLAANLMSFHRNADEKIKEAIAKGEFDNLPGKGKPLDLDAYFATPARLRVGYSILKSADIIPEEMELLKQIEGLKKSLDSCTSQIEKRAIQKQLSGKITNFSMRMERYRKKRSEADTDLDSCQTDDDRRSQLQKSSRAGWPRLETSATCLPRPPVVAYLSLVIGRKRHEK